jgi:Fe-S cluster assembly protein SufD
MNEISFIRSAAEDAIVSRYPSFAASQADWDAGPLARQRNAAFETLKANGLPNRRVEEWKYTDLRALLREMPPLAAAPAPDAAGMESAFPIEGADRIVFVDGADLSDTKAQGYAIYRVARGDRLPADVREAVDRKTTYAANAAVALNAAFLRDVTVIHIPAGSALKRPLHLDFRDSGVVPQASFSRVVVVAGKSASATIVESHAGCDGVASVANVLLQIEAADAADIRHIRANLAGDAAFALSTLGVRLGREAKFFSFNLTAGSAVSRHQMFFDLHGDNSELTVAGATLARGRQHADITMVADHAATGCTGRQLFKTVLDGRSRGVFQGLIVVRPGAQKTDGRMMSAALLLGDEAEMDNKPELEIFADDVQCAHGATTGALDDDLLFYLRARGIPKAEAERLLIQSFFGEAVERIEDEVVRAAIMARAEAWLAQRS